MNNTKILIVEDNKMNLNIATILLEHNNFSVICADNAATAIAMTKRHQPDLILMDIYLPNKSGLEVCAELKAEPLTSHIIIIGFTALASEEHIGKILSCGCAGVIVKPIEIETFADTIRSYLPQKTAPFI